MTTEQSLLEFSLIENGLDFIREALLYLSDETEPRKLKYSILHLFSGIEILLKAKLLSEHWSLIFANIDKARLEDVNRAEFSSVRFDKLLQRLANICGMTISKSDDQLLSRIRKLRNQLEHFSTNFRSSEIIPIVNGGVSFIISFITNYLPALSDNERELLEDIQVRLGRLVTYIDHRTVEIEPEISKLQEENCLVVRCPRCLQFAMVLGDGDPKCYFCLYSSTPEDVSGEHVDRLLQNEPWFDCEIHSCPECGLFSLVDSFDESKYICYTCGNSWDQAQISQCVRCERLFAIRFGEPNGFSLCGECWEELLSKD